MTAGRDFEVSALLTCRGAWRRIGGREMRQRSEAIHSETMTSIGWSDAAYGDQPTMGERCMGYVIGLMSSTLRGPRQITKWTSKLTRRLDESSLGGEVYAFSEMIDHVSMLREFYGHFIDLTPGVVGMEDGESLFTHHGKVLSPSFLGRSTGLGDAGAGQYISDSRIGKPGRWLVGNQGRYGPSATTFEIRRAQPWNFAPLKGHRVQ